jgi:hypothetical protein
MLFANFKHFTFQLDGAAFFSSFIMKRLLKYQVQRKLNTPEE